MKQLTCEMYSRNINSSLKPKKNKIIIIIILTFVLVTGIILSGFFVLKPFITYSNAIEYIENGEYDKAIVLFQELEDYKDSKDKIIEAKYLKVKSFMKSGDYKAAYDLLDVLANYKDCDKLKIECIYQQAVAAVEDEDFRNARTLLNSITDNNKNEYKDSKTLYDKCDQLEKQEKLKIKYNDAKRLYKNKKYYKAAYSFKELKDKKYKDSEKLFNESVYNYYIQYVNDIEEKVKNNKEIVFEEDEISIWINSLIEKSYKDIDKWQTKFNNLIDEYYRIEAKLIINDDGSKEEKGAEYKTGIYELAMVAKITKSSKAFSENQILFTVDYSGPTILINGKHHEYSANVDNGYAYAYIYTPSHGTYDIKIYSNDELLDHRTVTIIDSE